MFQKLSYYYLICAKSIYYDHIRALAAGLAHKFVRNLKFIHFSTMFTSLPLYVRSVQYIPNITFNIMAILNPNKDCFLNKFELVNYFR